MRGKHPRGLPFPEDTLMHSAPDHPARRRPAAAALAVAALAVGVSVLGCATVRNPVPSIPTGSAGHLPGKFVWHALLTDDVAGAERFYGRLFGWTFEPVANQPDYHLIRSGGRAIGAVVYARPTATSGPITQWLSFLSVADVDAAAARFSGGKVHLRGADVPGFGRVALVSDPYGAPLALVRSASGDPADGAEPAVHDWLWREYITSRPKDAAAFYGALAGYEAKAEAHAGLDDYWVFWSGGKGRAGMVAAPDLGRKSMWLPYVRVADAVAAADRARSLGGSVVLAPTPEIRDGNAAVIRDPRGALLALQKYPF
jgi:predicted enzyme related to lactoylglutathione lyase